MSGSCRDSVRGVVGTMNAARSRPDWFAIVQTGRKQAQSRVCTPGFSDCKLDSQCRHGDFKRACSVTGFYTVAQLFIHNEIMASGQKL